MLRHWPTVSVHTECKNPAANVCVFDEKEHLQSCRLSRKARHSWQINKTEQNPSLVERSKSTSDNPPRSHNLTFFFVFFLRKKLQSPRHDTRGRENQNKTLWAKTQKAHLWVARCGGGGATSWDAAKCDLCPYVVFSSSIVVRVKYSQPIREMKCSSASAIVFFVEPLMSILCLSPVIHLFLVCLFVFFGGGVLSEMSQVATRWHWSPG